MLSLRAKKWSSKMKVFVTLLFPLVLIIVSLFASQKLFGDTFYTSHDGQGHVIRMIEFHEAVGDGQIPVRIAKRINYGMGYPYFNFNYPLIYYLGEGFHLIGLSFVDSFKILMILSAIIGSIGMYGFTLMYFGRMGAFVCALFFTIAPYKFLNMYVRGNVAESFGLALIPLTLWAVDHFTRGGRYKYPFLIGTISMLILAHNITAVIGIVLCMAFFLFRIQKAKNKGKMIRLFACSLGVSLLLTSFFWVPVVVESKLTKLVELTEDYKGFFPTLPEIIYSPWGFGLYKQGEFAGKMSPQIGIIHEVVFLIAIMLFALRVIRIRKWEEGDRFFLFFAVITAISIFLALSSSQFIWDRMYVLQVMQFPWRFIGYVTLGTSIAAGFLTSHIASNQQRGIVIVILAMLLLYANRNHIRVNQSIVFENPFEKSDIYGPSTTVKDEHMPRSAARVFSEQKSDGDVIPPDLGKSKRLTWESNYHRFEVNLSGAADFRDNSWYFPGWTARIDNKTVDLKKDSRLLVTLPQGRYTVEFFFGETWYRKLADILSVATFISGIGILLWKKEKLL